MTRRNVLMAVVVVVATFLFVKCRPPNQSPGPVRDQVAEAAEVRSAVEEFQTAVERKDYPRIYDALDVESRAFVDKLMETTKLNPEMAPHRFKTGRELYVAVNQESEKWGQGIGTTGRLFQRVSVEGVQLRGDTAILFARNGEGELQQLKVVWQEGRWRLNMNFHAVR